MSRQIPLMRLGLDLEIEEADGYWLAGFVSGDGYFLAGEREKDGAHWPEMAFGINMRKDELPLLVELQKLLGGIGSKLCYEGHWPSPSRDYRSKPFARWTVRDLGQLYHIIIPLFEKFPLRGRKAAHFVAWKETVQFAYRQRSLRRGKSYSNEFWERYRALVKDFRATREYVDPEE